MVAGVDTAVREAVLKVRASVGLARLANYALYAITGLDAPRFLQSRLSNDVLALPLCGGQMNAALDRQGKIEGVFSLHRAADQDFLLLVEKDAAEATIKGILKYRITEQVTVTEQPDVLFSLQGPQAPAILAEWRHLPAGALAEYGLAVPEGAEPALRLIRRTLSGEAGFVLAVPPERADEIERELKERVHAAGGVSMTPEIRETLRIEAGQPRYGLDYDHETLLPETGLEREAVSYSKGCYLGQETIARIRTYGMVQKALVGLLFEAGTQLPPPGGECLIDGKPVGVIRSSADSPMLERPVALAYLGKSERIPGKSLSLEINGQVFRAVVSLLPFYAPHAKGGAELLSEGLKLFSEGYDEEAVRVLREAIRNQPDMVDAYEALGVILSRQDRYDEAIRLMEKILELDPEHVLAHTNLSVFYMKLGDKEKAEQEKAKATMAAFSRKAKEAGLAFDIEAERRKKEEAAQARINMFLDALKFNPDDPLGNFGLGSAYLELRRYDEAIPPFETVIRVQPKHSVAYLSLGKALEGAGKPVQAKAIYDKGIEVAAAKGDLMPLKEMQSRLAGLSA